MTDSVSDSAAVHKDEMVRGGSACALRHDGSMLAVVTARRGGQEVRETAHIDSSGNEILRSRVGDTLRRLPSVTAIFPMDDGRILVGGHDLRRFLRDGTQDSTFRVTASLPSIRKIVMQGEKILVLSAGGQLQRLESSGAIDSVFRIPLLKVYSGRLERRNGKPGEGNSSFRGLLSNAKSAARLRDGQSSARLTTTPASSPPSNVPDITTAQVMWCHPPRNRARRQYYRDDFLRYVGASATDRAFTKATCKLHITLRAERLETGCNWT
jgi:hypothetical protein